MGFINKKAHNVRHDRFSTPEKYKTVENKIEIITPLVINEAVEAEVVNAEIIAMDDVLSIEQPKKKKNKKKEENNNVETIE